MAHSEDNEPIVIPLREPPPPPPLPSSRRLIRLFVRAWPFMAWCGAIAASVWLYFGETGHGHALAIEEVQEIKVAPAVSGRLVTLAVELGQKVREGDLIATLDTRDLDARLRMSKTEVERQRTRIGAEREVLRLDLQDRQAQAAARRNAYEAEGRRLRGELERLSSEQAADQGEIDSFGPQIERLKPLVEKKLVTADRLEDLLQKRTVFEKRIGSRTQLIKAAREELDGWSKLGPDKLPDPNLDARLLPFELELKAQEARVAELEVEREKYRITSPVTGTVNAILARGGEWRGVGAEIIQVVVPRPNRMTAYVMDRQIPVVAPGTRATLRPRDHGGPALEGKVSLVGPRIEELPVRLRPMSTIKQWGRQITIQVEKSGDPLPGEIYDVRFH